MRKLGIPTTVLLALAAFPLAATDIAFLRRTDGFWQVWVIDANGKKPHQVTRSQCDKTRLSWLPDGEALMFCCVPGDVRQVSIRTGVETAIQLGTPGVLDAVVSPDGTRIAYSFNRAEAIDGNDLWVSSVDGTGRRKLAGLPGLQHEPAWSADGKTVYFLSGEGGSFHDIWSVAVDDAESAPSQLTKRSAFHFDVATSGDGTLAFSSNRSGDYEIWLREPSGSERQLTNRPELDARPSFSPDGRRLVVESTTDGVPNLQLIDLASGKGSALTRFKDGARAPGVEEPMKIVAAILAGTLFIAEASAAPEGLTINGVIASNQQFDPARGETVRLQFSVSHPASVDVLWIDAANQIVRSQSVTSSAAGPSEVSWDGRSSRGEFVPAEAYRYVIRAKSSDQETVIYDLVDATANGLLPVSEIAWIPEEQAIRYQVGKLSRVRLRAGLAEGGPLLVTVVNWAVRSPGENREPWNGRDASGFFNLGSDGRREITAVAYELPRTPL